MLRQETLFGSNVVFVVIIIIIIVIIIIIEWSGPFERTVYVCGCYSIAQFVNIINFDGTLAWNILP